jgi:pimeloyl-ACP methyl ester carboxylesterase
VGRIGRPVPPGEPRTIDGRLNLSTGRAERAPRLAVNGVELEYVEAGSGVAVVFSHGGASDVRYWAPQQAAFSRERRFIAYSRRFHGAGSWPPEADASPQSHADDLVAIAMQLAAGPVHLVGFSTSVALIAAARQPALFRSLTIVEPNAPSLLTDDPVDREVERAWKSATERLRDLYGTEPARLAETWFELVNNQGPGAFGRQPAAFRQMWLANFGARRSPSVALAPACDDLGAITLPTLVIGTEYGMPYSRRIVRRVAECIPGARTVILPSAMHFVSYQDPAVFNEVVLAFLAAH